MARSKKDGKRGGGHKTWKGSWLKMDGKCGADGKPMGVKEPFSRKPKRQLKRRTGKSRRRVNRELLRDAVSESSPRRGGQWKGHVKITKDFDEIPDGFE